MRIHRLLIAAAMTAVITACGSFGQLNPLQLVVQSRVHEYIQADSAPADRAAAIISEARALQDRMGSADAAMFKVMAADRLRELDLNPARLAAAQQVVAIIAQSLEDGDTVDPGTRAGAALDWVIEAAQLHVAE